MTWRREQDITQQRARVSASLASMLEIYKTFDQEDGQSAAKKPRAVPDHCWPQGGIPGAGLAEVSSPGKSRPRRPGGNQPRTWPLLKLEEDSKSDMQYMQRASHLLEALLLRIDESAKILDNLRQEQSESTKNRTLWRRGEILKATGSADRQRAALQSAARRLEARWVSDAGLRQHSGRF